MPSPSRTAGSSSSPSSLTSTYTKLTAAVESSFFNFLTIWSELDESIRDDLMDQYDLTTLLPPTSPYHLPLLKTLSPLLHALHLTLPTLPKNLHLPESYTTELTGLSSFECDKDCLRDILESCGGETISLTLYSLHVIYNVETPDTSLGLSLNISPSLVTELISAYTKNHSPINKVINLDAYIRHFSLIEAWEVVYNVLKSYCVQDELFLNVCDLLGFHEEATITARKLGVVYLGNQKQVYLKEEERLKMLETGEGNDFLLCVSLVRDDVGVEEEEEEEEEEQDVEEEQNGEEQEEVVDALRVLSEEAKVVEKNQEEVENSSSSSSSDDDENSDLNLLAASAAGLPEDSDSNSDSSDEVPQNITTTTTTATTTSTSTSTPSRASPRVPDSLANLTHSPPHSPKPSPLPSPKPSPTRTSKPSPKKNPPEIHHLTPKDLTTLTIPELQSSLKRQSKSTTGSKSQLISRLQSSLEFVASPDTQNLDGRILARADSQGHIHVDDDAIDVEEIEELKGFEEFDEVVKWEGMTVKLLKEECEKRGWEVGKGWRKKEIVEFCKRGGVVVVEEEVEEEEEEEETSSRTSSRRSKKAEKVVEKETESMTSSRSSRSSKKAPEKEPEKVRSHEERSDELGIR
ncbi:hypothetical protein TL16_g09507 [Triparma laevis f. inornata]|uniref:SAP domain-containing protein n=1 Tax=Triparma laevis f. inornata TaxID=1714386 RepID=A0A9W7B2J4_9STRA|nr:hypothetical protein TL16_g09507 [Triparma laevis f. inornata]